MKIEKENLFYNFVCGFCAFVSVVSATCGSGSPNVDSLVQRGVALDGAAFWTCHVDDITSCAVSCLRRRVCKSFNYNLYSNLCELNEAHEGEMPFRAGTNSLVYSTIDYWPAEFDPACSHRPCKDNQVCVPGLFGNIPGNDTCSYLCMDNHKVCAKPFPDFSGGRSVGDVVTINCSSGEFGGGIAECLTTKQWNDSLTQCALVYNSLCFDDSKCSEIDAICTNGTCQCIPRMDYERNESMCIWDLYGDPCVNNMDCLEMNGVCQSGACDCANTSVYDNSTRMCLDRFKLEPGTGGDGISSGQLFLFHGGQWNHVCEKHMTWTVIKAICNDMNPAFSFGGTFHGSNVYGDSVDPPSVELHNPDCGVDGSVTSYADCPDPGEIKDCSEDKIGVTCYESNMTSNVRVDTNYTGASSELRLEVMWNGVWGTVCSTDWSDADTDVSCKSVNSSLPNRDGHCTSSCAEGPAGPYMIDSLVCTGDEPSLFYCRNGGWDITHSCPGSEVAIKCK